MKIVIIVSYTYPYIGSGIGQVALKQAEYLAKNGNNVSLISSNIPKSKEKFYKDNVLHLKQKSIDILERVGIPVPLFFFNTKALKAIKEADIVYVHDIMYPSSFLAAILSKIYKKKLFVTVHITHVSYNSNLLNMIELFIRNTIGVFILTCAEKIIIINKGFVKDKMLKKFKNKLVFIPNGVDLKLFKPITIKEKKILRIKYDLPLNRPIVLFVGRFVQKKGFHLMLKALSDKYLMILIGDTKNQINFQKTDDLIILGEMKQDKLADYYKMSDVFVLPSHGEGFPLSVQEAMSSGLPIVISNLKCYENVNLDKHLVKFINRTSSSIKNAIFEIFENPAIIRKMSQYSLKQSKKYYTWETNVFNLQKIFSEY